MKFLKNLFDENHKKIEEYKKNIIKVKQLIQDYENGDLPNKFINSKLDNIRELFTWLDYTNIEDSKRIESIFRENKIEIVSLILYAIITVSKDKTNDFNLIPYDTQLMWLFGIIDNNILEMKTGEWKSLVSFMWAIFKSLYWKSIHIVSINDYLTKRDTKDFKPLADFLNIEIWLIQEWASSEDRRKEYAKNIVYVTHQELTFDYLKDNMFLDLDNIMIKDFYFCIIDEIDSILIDEAKSPIMISIPTKEDRLQYMEYKALSNKISWNAKNIKIDKELRIVNLTDEWIGEIERLLKIDNMFISEHFKYLNWVENALKAEFIYLNNTDYVIENWKVVIIDTNTWRLIHWRTFPAGIQQSIEAKEWIKISKDNKILASITYQNLFKLYNKLSWLSGTVTTEKEEFQNTYNTEVIEIPRKNKNNTKFHKDLFFKTYKWKVDFLINEVKDINKTGQPILIGVLSIEQSNDVSNGLNKLGIQHDVLNAVNYENEAEIISNAWQVWSITIVTNIAWRWTDIKISDEANKLWWMFVFWLERNESRRLDNQLSGRVWRQWDNWEVIFLISPEDEIVSKYNGDTIQQLLNSPIFITKPENEPILDSKLLSNAINRLQRKIEWWHYESRKYIIWYDNSLTKHRQIIYNKRKTILSANEDSLNELIIKTFHEFINLSIKHNIESNITIYSIIDNKNINIDESKIQNFIIESEIILKDKLNKLKWNFKNKEYLKLLQKVLINNIDESWSEHLSKMSELKVELSFIWNLQKDPLQEYQTRAFDLFTDLNYLINEKHIKLLAQLSTDWINEIINNKSQKQKNKIVNDFIINFWKNEDQRILDIAMVALTKSELTYIWQDVKVNWFIDYTIPEHLRPLSKNKLEFIWDNIKKTGLIIYNKTINRI